MADIIITNFTDPVCVWCWATEPVFRALETRYPGRVEIRYVMGGMVRSLEELEDPANHISGQQPDVNGQVMSHWLESVPRHRMPIEPKGFALFGPDTPSTWPQNIAYKAAQIASPKLADKYLRMIRLNTLAAGRQTGRREVLEDIARETGIDMQAFTRALDDGRAERAFQMDMGLMAAMGVGVFPTFQVKSAQARQFMMRGFNTREDFENVFHKLTGEQFSPLPSPPDEDVLQWLYDSHGPLSLEEIYQAFDFDSREASARWVDGLLSAGTWRKQPAGESFFLLPA